MQERTLKSFSEHNSSEEGAVADLVFWVAGEGVRRFQGRDAKSSRRAVQNAVIYSFGLIPHDVEIIIDVLDHRKYELMINLKTEAWLKSGKSTTMRDPNRHVIETVVEGFITALQNAQKDERPVRRRAV